MDPAQSARREQERVMKIRERLRFRVYSGVRDVMLGSQLFRSNFQLHEPDFVVSAYAAFLDVNASLNEGQLQLIPVENRPRDLNRFAEDLRRGIEKVAHDLGLELSTDPAQYGGSGPVMLVDVPIGYRAVLLRRESEPSARAYG
jgi:hypothetical protein